MVAYPLAPQCEAGSGSIKGAKTCAWAAGRAAIPLALIRHELYLSWARHYANSSRFFVADFRDTVFQRDPFAGLPPPAHALELWLYAEHFPFKQFKRCPFNAGWVRNCWGKEKFAPLRDRAALCSGSYLGTRDGVAHFEATLLGEVADARCHEKDQASDQGYLNWLYYSGRLPGAVVHDRGYGLVNTVGALCPGCKRHRYPVGALGPKFWRLRDRDGYVLQDDGATRSAVVHQYDRFDPEINGLVAKLNCNGCWPPPSRAATADDPPGPAPG